VAHGAMGERSETEDFGSLGQENFLSVLQGLSMAVMTRRLGIVHRRKFFLRGEGRDHGRKVHCYAPITFVYGRKLEEEE
jgi:hypothetical protein